MSESGAWPVIIHQLSSSTDIAGILRQQHFKLRVSESIIPGSLIFPLSGVAFIILPLSHAASTDPETRLLQLTSEVTDRYKGNKSVKTLSIDNAMHNAMILEKFHQTHRNCYCLCQAQLHGQTERSIYSLIQKKYMFTRLRLLPVHNANEAVHTMVNIAKALWKPTKEVLGARLDHIIAEQENRDFISASLKHLGLSNHQIYLLEDSFGSMAKLSTATHDELLDSSLDTDSVLRILAFFNKDEE